MANWIPILILIPFVFSVVLMLGRNLGGNAARWIGLVGTLVTLTGCLAISGAYYKYISEGPPSVKTDDAGNPIAMCSNLPGRLFAKLDKLIEFQKIAWGITTNGQLGKHNQLNALGFGLFNMRNDLVGVVFKIANMIVELC